MKRRTAALATRRQPLQQRAKDSVDAILRTAAVLLDEVGVEGFNTNLLAQRAGVRVRTVYRYFPNKYSVIVAVTDAMSRRWDSWMTGYYTVLATPDGDWRRALRTMLKKWLRHTRSEPGSVAVLQAINATPELRELHDRIFDGICGKLVTALCARGVRASRSRLLAMARVMASSMNSGAELYFRLPPREAREFLRQLEDQHEKYLAPYLDR